MVECHSICNTGGWLIARANLLTNGNRFFEIIAVYVIAKCYATLPIEMQTAKNNAGWLIHCGKTPALGAQNARNVRIRSRFAGIRPIVEDIIGHISYIFRTFGAICAPRAAISKQSMREAGQSEEAGREVFAGRG